ncbi:putative bifunctional diguanylate cyclase/phosphodiesterase [Pseudoduganella sp. GCM10020061]|uniref:putative bifunctional diguanylate cyclase/phosphodiesterase n=1 Tax=Pseudoduganella sp. GCM10020061 TaxID=3317345 RepID=UPI0036318283
MASPIELRDRLLVIAVPLLAALACAVLWSRVIAAEQADLAGARQRTAMVEGWAGSAVVTEAPPAGEPAQDAMEQAAERASRRRDEAAFLSVLATILAPWFAVALHRTLRRWREDAESRRVYWAAVQHAEDGMYMATAVRNRDGGLTDFDIVDCNERGASFFGMSRSELTGVRVSTLDQGASGSGLLDACGRAMACGFDQDEREMPPGGRGRVQWVQRRIVRVGNSLSITLQDITARKAHEEALYRSANEDLLTALPNRHWLAQSFQALLAKVGREGRALPLLLIDLDEFKQVNDTHGHAAGDMVLQQAARRLKSLLRPDDVLVRFGGDEFVVLLGEDESDAHAGAVAQRIVDALARPFSVGEQLHSVGASIGIGVFPRDGRDPASLLQHADIAMYWAKEDGKGRFRFFDSLRYASVKGRARLKQQLALAVERNELLLHFQPRVDLRTGRVCSMEALLRWQHPEMGFVPPSDFIPLAESGALIHRIGDLVVEKACAQLSAWRAMGLQLVPVSINVSPRQFEQGGVHRMLAAQLALHKLSPRLIEVEITESAMMGEQKHILEQLAAIRKLGVKLHVDDFGSGYSSLSQLALLRMDVLKVDRSFTAGLSKSPEGRVFYQAIVSMAHALGMAIVAEGVETEEQLRVVRELGCDEAQGYHLGRPAPADQVAPFLERGLAAHARAAVPSPDFSN